MSDGTDLRDEFLLDRSVTFLNHGSFGACPRAVFERYQQWQLELERQPVLFLARRLDELLAEARGAVGAYVAADPDDLVFVPNATAGVNIARGPNLFLHDAMVTPSWTFRAATQGDTERAVANEAGVLVASLAVPVATAAVSLTRLNH